MTNLKFDLKHGLALASVILSASVLALIQVWWPVLIIPDELTYSLYASHYPWTEPSNGQYLYSLAYSWVDMFGSGFYLAAKILNFVFWGISAVILYGIALFYFGPISSATIAVIHLVMPFSFYVSSFMPEALLILLMMLSLFVLIAYMRFRSILFLVGLSFALFLATLTKAQGSIFTALFVALLLGLFLIQRDKALLYAGLASILALVLRAIFGISMGEASPFIFGSYNDVAFGEESPLISAATGVETLGLQLLDSFLIHMAILLMVSSIAIWIISPGFLRSDPFLLLVYGVFIGLILMAIAYHSLAVLRGEPLGTQTITRYFEGFLVVATLGFTVLLRDATLSKWRVALAVTLPIVGLLVAILRPMVNQTTANSAIGDNLSANGWAFAAGFVAVQLVIVVVISANKSIPFTLIPFSVFIPLIFIYMGNWSFYASDGSYDLAGRAIGVITDAQPESRILVVGSNEYNVKAAVFYGNSLNIDGAPTDRCLPEGDCSYDYVVFLDEKTPSGEYEALLVEDQFSVYRVKD